jgi:hypothetical protein
VFHVSTELYLSRGDERRPRLRLHCTATADRRDRDSRWALGALLIFGNDVLIYFEYVLLACTVVGGVGRWLPSTDCLDPPSYLSCSQERLHEARQSLFAR